MKSAQDDVVGDPNQEKPAGPVGATEHKDGANNREEPDKANPEDVILKRTVGLELSGVVGESDNAGDEKQESDDGDWERPFVHGVGANPKSGRANSP